jgi:hypothetical protein
MKCPYCKEETDTLYNNPFTVIDIRTGEEKEDVMCRECLTFTLQEMSPYGNDCPNGICDI